MAAVLLVLASMLTCASAIINGTRARNSEYPFMVSLQWDGRHKCGGTLLDADTILTAAHCYPLIWVNLNQPRRVTALLGTVDSTAAGNWPAKRVGIRRVIFPRSLLHLNASQLLTAIFTEDLMLLKTNERIRPTPTIKYADIRPVEDATVGNTCTVIGWGRSQSPDEVEDYRANIFPSILRKGVMTVISSSQCSETPRPEILCVTPVVIDGRPRGMPCFGDSGSPLVCKDSRGKAFVAGFATEAAVPCNAPDIPAIYLRIPSFRRWIIRRSGMNRGKPRKRGH